MKRRRHNILIISLKKKKKYVFKDNRQPDSDGKGDGLSSILAYDPIMLGGEDGGERRRERRRHCEGRECGSRWRRTLTLGAKWNQITNHWSY